MTTPQIPGEAELERILSNPQTIKEWQSYTSDGKPTEKVHIINPAIKSALLAWRDQSQDQVTDMAATGSGAVEGVSNPPKLYTEAQLQERAAAERAEAAGAVAFKVDLWVDMNAKGDWVDSDEIRAFRDELLAALTQKAKEV